MYTYIPQHPEKTAIPPVACQSNPDLWSMAHDSGSLQSQIVGAGPWNLSHGPWSKMHGENAAGSGNLIPETWGKMHDAALIFWGSESASLLTRSEPDSWAIYPELMARFMVHESLKMHDFAISEMPHTATRIDSTASMLWGRSVYLFSIQTISMFKWTVCFDPIKIGFSVFEPISQTL